MAEWFVDLDMEESFKRRMAIRDAISHEMESWPLTPSVCKLYEYLRQPVDDDDLKLLISNLVLATRNN